MSLLAATRNWQRSQPAVSAELYAASRRQRNSRLRCDCSGYWFPHRRGGGACEHSPRADYYLALRQGLPWWEALSLLSAEHILRIPLQRNT